MTILTIKFEHLESTKGAHKFGEIDSQGNVLNPMSPGAVVGSLYVRKTSLLEAPPYLLVTIETQDA